MEDIKALGALLMMTCHEEHEANQDPYMHWIQHNNTFEIWISFPWEMYMIVVATTVKDYATLEYGLYKNKVIQQTKKCRI